WLPAGDGASREAAAVVAPAFGHRYGDDFLQAALSRRNPEIRDGLRKLGEAIALNQSGQYDLGTAAATDAVAALSREGPLAAAERARLELAYDLQRQTRRSDCARLTEQILRDASLHSWKWLASGAHLMHAACREALAGTGASQDEILATLARAELTGFTAQRLRALGFLTGYDGVTGNFQAIWDRAPQGIASWWRSGLSPARLEEFQYDLFRAAAGLGWKESAIAMSRGAIRSLTEMKNPAMEAANRMELAGLLTQTDERSAAAEQLEIAGRILRTLAPGAWRDDLEWNAGLALSEAEITAGRAGAALDRIAGMEGREGPRRSSERARLAQARGEALFALAKWGPSAQAFRAAMALNRERAAAMTSYTDRIAETDTLSAAYRRLTQIELLQEDAPAKALSTWQRFLGRASNADRTLGQGHTPLVTYAVLPAGIAVWVSAESGVQWRLIHHGVPEIERLGTRLTRLCASPLSDESEIKKTGQQLYRVLLAPEMAGLPGGRIDLQTDAWISSLPFEALATESGEYLSRSYAFAEATGGSGGRSDNAPDGSAAALIVAAPRVDGPAGYGLPNLRDAEEEAADAGSHFRSAVFLRDEQASPESISEHAP
ncbi:MAG: CHAT domain-containing protein, partial [Bryobacteraceae bacterium]